MNLAPRPFSNDQNEVYDAIKFFGGGKYSGMKDAFSARESQATSRRDQTNEFQSTPWRWQQLTIKGCDGQLCRPGRTHGAQVRVHRASGRSAAGGTQESWVPPWMWVLTFPAGFLAAPMNMAAHSRSGERLVLQSTIPTPCGQHGAKLSPNPLPPFSASGLGYLGDERQGLLHTQLLPER